MMRGLGDHRRELRRCTEVVLEPSQNGAEWHLRVRRSSEEKETSTYSTRDVSYPSMGSDSPAWGAVSMQGLDLHMFTLTVLLVLECRRHRVLPKHRCGFTATGWLEQICQAQVVRVCRLF